MSENMVRTVFTYLIALVVIVGGGVLVVIPTQLEADTLVPFMFPPLRILTQKPLRGNQRDGRGQGTEQPGTGRWSKDAALPMCARCRFRDRTTRSATR